MDGTDGQTRRDEPTEGSTRGPRGPKMLHTNQYVKEIVTHLMPILTKSNWYSVTIPYWYFQNVLFSISITFFKSSFSSFLSQLGEIIPKKSFFRNPKWDRNYDTRPGPETEVISFPCLQKSRQTSVECVFRLWAIPPQLCAPALRQNLVWELVQWSTPTIRGEFNNLNKATISTQDTSSN